MSRTSFLDEMRELLESAPNQELREWRLQNLVDRLNHPLLIPRALLALEELLTEPPTSETTCESGERRSATLLAPSGQCPSCDRRRALLNAAKKRHREERRGG